MKKFVPIFALALGGGFCAAAEPSVRPLAVAVVWEDVQEAFDGFPTLNQLEPVKLVLLADLGGLGVIELNDAKSKLDSLTDDAGRNLKGEIWGFPDIAKGGKLLRVQLNGEDSPTAGAKSISAKGSLAIMTGSETASHKSELVPADKGAVVTITDGLSFEISKAGKPQWGDAPFMVELEIKRDIPELAELVFYDEGGKVIESSEGGSSRMGFLNKVTVQKSYNLERKVKSFRVEAKLWTDLKEVTVPFDVTVGIGGGR